MNNAKGDDAAAGSPDGRREGVLTEVPRQTHYYIGNGNWKKLFDQLGIVDLKNNNFLSFGPVKVVVFLFKRSNEARRKQAEGHPFSLPSLP